MINVTIQRRYNLKDSDRTILASWRGPYSWPSFEAENKLDSIPKISGAYLWAFDYMDGYLIYAAGITRRPIPSRFREHTHKYLNGEYTILDISEVRKGIRGEIWHGWGYAREHRDEFERNKIAIQEAARAQLADFRVFVASITSEGRVLERLEASIMNCLYKMPPPLCNIPDKGMQLAPRWDSENTIVVKNEMLYRLHGLPEVLEI